MSQTDSTNNIAKESESVDERHKKRSPPRYKPSVRDSGSSHRKRFRRSTLPIDGVKEELTARIRSSATCIIAGETGSGKSTQVPQFCIDGGLCGNGLVAITQPRRVAAITLAKRVAMERKSEVGEEVGYKVRFENFESDETKIVYGTDGIFLREALHDSILSRYSVIIVDEAHERSVHTDVLLYVLNLCQNQRKNTENPLKLIIMSATLDTDIFSIYFHEAPVYLIQGRNYPVEIFYGNSLTSHEDYVFNALVTVFQLHQSEPLDFDILVFLTGQEEIESACKKVMEASKLLPGGIIALPLYAGLSPSAQMRVFEPVNEPDTRKVVFSTNIAETSVTIPGIRIVIDTGKIKMRTFLEDRRIDVLRVENISKASAIQRAGRAGREQAGKCYRLYSEKHYQSLETTTKPEILRSNLTTVLLELCRMGMHRLSNLSNFITPPSDSALNSAILQLKLLEALRPLEKKDRYSLSDLGYKLAEFPIDPALARVLLAAGSNECLEEALTVVSFMSADNVFLISSSQRDSVNVARQKFEAAEGDHFTLLNIYKGYRAARRDKSKREWCSANFLNERVLDTIFKIRKQLREICKKNNLTLQSCGMERIKLRKAMCEGLFMNACEYDRTNDCYNLIGSAKMRIKIHPSSCLSRSRPSAFIFTDLVRTSDLYARDITVIDDQWVKEVLMKKKHIINKM
ncbi:hypothetical protein AB6A40_005735 [Gnathostoma spinigerum]|uniref:RNA helicase n=1 Tax=Gnathostoma spinigerum TaxID=75299 RepID=A0ABD6EH31_9BILA